MSDLNTLQWTVLIAAALIFGLAKSGLPGLGILGIPLVALVIPGRASTGLILPMLIIGDVFAVSYYHRSAQWVHFWRLMPWAVAGVGIGSVAMNHVSDAMMGPVIGGIVLAMLALHFWRRWQGGAETVPTHWSFAAGMGLLGGITTMMANAAGPIMFIYLLAMRLPKNEFLGTGAWYFLVVNWIKVPFSVGLGLISAESLRLNLFLAPAIVTGALVGVVVARRIPQTAFGTLVEILTAVAAIKLLF